MDVGDFERAIGPWIEPGRGQVGARLSLAIRQAIATGMLTRGDRLPPERALAAALHVSRPTVSGVIDELRSAGLVVSRQGSGTWVADTDTSSIPTVPFAELLHATGLIDLAAATAPDAGSLPDLTVDTGDLLDSEPANGLNPTGLASLRRAIAERANLTSPGTDESQVVVTSGAHQALALLVASLVERGDTVLVEDTTYGGLIDIIAANGARAIGVARDADGTDPAALATALERHEPAATILVSSVHSPTGQVSSAERSDELAAVLRRTRGHVVLDETYAELDFAGTTPRIAAALGQHAIRVGSLSKSLWTGLRIGWIIAPAPLCREIVATRWARFDLGPSIPAQVFAQRAIEHLPEVLPARRQRLADRARWLTATIESSFPEWSVDPIDGGLAAWVDLGDRDGRDYAMAAADRGVAVLPGSACCADRAPTTRIRVCFDRPVDVLETAFERLPRTGRSALPA